MISDRRVKYTKMALKEALIKLMRDKPVSRITVKSICDEADVNRSTYYAHYTDQLDQLEKIEIEFIEDIERLLENMARQDPVAIVTKIFDYIAQNRDLCRALMSPNGDIAFESKIIEFLRSSVFSMRRGEDPKLFSVEDYVYTYTLSGGVGLVKKWLADDSGAMSSAAMANLMLGLAKSLDGMF